MATSRDSLCKISSAGKKEYYMMTTLHEDGENGLDISMCDGDNAWNGSVSGDDLKQMARKIKMKLPEYLGLTAKALTRENVGSLNFLYQVKDMGDEVVDLIWKKHMASENIKIQLGSISLQLQSEPSRTIKEMFEQAIKSAETLQERIVTVHTDNERLASERATALKRLEKCVSAKEHLETDLYSKFVTVLNDKKSKIRELREEVEDATSASSSHTAKVSTGSKRAAAASAAAASTPSDSDETADEERSSPHGGRGDKSDSEYDTDEDNRCTPSQAHKSIAVKKELSDSVGESSLLLDDGLQDDDVPVATKRRRRGAASSTKKATPSKPVLPKVPSGEGKVKTPKQSSRPSSSRSSSMRKTSSTRSNRSDNIDEDELYDDF